MKAAIFCAKMLNPLIVYSLLPDSVSEIISAIGFDFCAESVARQSGCLCTIVKSVDEAVEQADFIFAIWDGLTQGIVDAVKIAKRSGKRVMFSLIP